MNLQRSTGHRPTEERQRLEKKDEIKKNLYKAFDEIGKSRKR